MVLWDTGAGTAAAPCICRTEARSLPASAGQHRHCRIPIAAAATNRLLHCCWRQWTGCRVHFGCSTGHVSRITNQPAACCTGELHWELPCSGLNTNSCDLRLLHLNVM